MRRAAAFLISLVCLSLSAQDIKPTEGYLEKFSRKVPPAARAQTPLLVEAGAAQTPQSFPVTFGVPFPRGALRSEMNVRLLENGAEIPAFVRKTATWERPDGDVRWLLLDASFRPGQQYALEYGAGVVRAEAKSDLRVEDGKDAVAVSTGPLRFVVSRTQPGLVHAVWMTDKAAPVVAPGSNPAPYMVDHQGVRYALGPDDYTVSVEQSGPLRAVVRIEGWYQSDQGVKLCRMVARLHAWAGQSFIRLEHTFVVAFDTDKTRLRDIAIPLAVDAGPEARGSFGLEGAGVRELKGPASLVQDSADHFALKGGDGVEVASGKRASGWVDLSSSETGVTLAVRRFWQEYPRELEVAGNMIVAHLWPARHDRLLDFDAKATLGPDLYKEWGDKVYWQDWYKGGLDQYDQAYGLAKSNDLMIVFHGADRTGAAALCRTLDEPVIVCATPEWMCRSDVMGPLRPRDTKGLPDVERKLDLGFSRFEWFREHLGNYGLIHFGDVNYHHVLNTDKNRWEWRPWRCWASRFYGHPVMPWVGFLRTADRRYLQWGVDNARHVMDIDMCHLTNEKVGDYKFPKRRGGRYGGNGGIIHYGADIYDIGCDSHVDHLLLQYYLTGYRRAWDVLMEEADFYLWKETQAGGSLHAWGHRMTGGAMRTMTALYQATWDPRYLKLAQRMAEFCYQNQDSGGIIRFDDVYMAPGMVTYYQATGDERMRDLFLRCMRYQAKVGRDEADPRSWGYYGLAMAFFMTGDAAFLPWGERWKTDFVRCVNDSEDPFWRGDPKGQWDYCYLTLHLLYMPYYLEAARALGGPVQPITLDNAVTSGSIILHREKAEPFRVSAEWFCYSSTHSTGAAVRRLDRYFARKPGAARLVLRGPTGAEIASAPLLRKQDAAKSKSGVNAPELPGTPKVDLDERKGKVALDAPAGPPGDYRLAIEDAGDLHYKLRLSSSDLLKWGYATQDEYLACAETYYFYVPPDAEKFSVFFKSLALRRMVEFTVHDPDGQMRRTERLDFGAEPQAQYLVWPFSAAPQHRGKLWRLCVDPPAVQVEQTYLKFQGVPPIVWTSAEAFFLPDEKGLQPRPRPSPVAEPYAGAGKALRIEPGKPLVIPRGERAGDRYKNINPQQGTLEFWFRPEWAPDDIADRTIAKCGKLHLYRRSRLGTYVNLAGTVQAGFVTEPGRWYHLAVTWDAGAPGREPKSRLFINGLDLCGNVLSAPKDPLGDWTGDIILIGGDAAFTVDDVRISDVVRYDADFALPETPAADAHTLFRDSF